MQSFLTWISTILWFARTFVGLLVWIALALAISLLYSETQTSEMQAKYLAAMGRKISFQVAAGESDAIRFPVTGPFDERMGYVQLPAFIRALQTQNYAVARQSRWSAELLRAADRSLFPPFQEKTQSGLRILDHEGALMFEGQYPDRVYPNFASIPKVLADTLLFIENRELLDNKHPKKNPAVEWDRLAKAVLDQALHAIDPDQDTPGGSTLATQIEKFRHSPDGRTASIKEKFRQMASASLRAYLGGEETIEARRRVILDYLNTVPLAAKPGVGEINGIGDGLWAWYGRDFGHINRLLHEKSNQDVSLDEQAVAYKQALSLMISQRRPSYYLSGNQQGLDDLSNSHLRVLAQAGVISAPLRDAALKVKLELRGPRTRGVPTSFIARKAANAARTGLAAQLKTARLYDLDRFDLTVTTTLDSKLQAATTNVLRGLKDPQQARAAHLVGPRMLEKGDPSKVVYSFTLYERTPSGNLLRVQTDNYDQPFDINEGAKLDLGSTAKLRTLVSYLEAVTELYRTHSGKPAAERAKVFVEPRDKLSRWMIDYLNQAANPSLAQALEAAMERRYSASPYEQFFTGGGLHTFENFNEEDDDRIMSVREAFRNSVNLVFVRLMRDVARYKMFNMAGSSAKILADADDPRRREYLERFADREGRVFITRFFQKYQGKSELEAEELLLQDLRPTRDRLAAIYMTIESDSTETGLVSFLHSHLLEDKPDDAAVKKLYVKYSPQAMSLADRGYVTGRHPLELWLVGFLRAFPGATLKQALEASVDERREVYSWLYRTRNKNVQDRRIKNLLELEGFLEIHRSWQRLGYPFDTIIPSYASALGSSADRPAALAELVGIIANGGKRLPIVKLARLHFAAGTPYETLLEKRGSGGEQVLDPEVAATVRRALMDVATNGTAKRLRGAYVRADKSEIAIGGKTGTGDNRYETYGAQGQVLTSRVVSRSATFVFFIGDKYYGTITAYVAGAEAAKFEFTSSLSVQIVKNLAPILLPKLAEDKSVLEVVAPVKEAPYPELPTPEDAITKSQEQPAKTEDTPEEQE